MPPRLCLLISSVVILFPLICLSFWAERSLKSLLCRKIGILLVRTGCRLWLLAFGVWWVEQKGLGSFQDARLASALVAVADSDNQQSQDVAEDSKQLQIKSKQGRTLIVSNHVGLLEILYFLYRFECAFLAAKQVKNLPVVGPIAESLGCYFIDREGRGSKTLEQTNSQRSYLSAEGTNLDTVSSSGGQNANNSMGLAHAPLSANPLCIFPEGTTTNGEQLIRFHSGAFVPMRPVLPCLVSFRFKRGRDFDPHWSSCRLQRYVFGLMCQPAVSMVVDIQTLLFPPGLDEMDAETGGDEEPPFRQYANKVRQSMASAAALPLIDRSYHHKRAMESAVISGRIPESAIYDYQAAILRFRNFKALR